jgi:hypothetical protein
MSMIFTLIQIKFNIDINNDELLKTMWNSHLSFKLIVIGTA